MSKTNSDPLAIPPYEVIVLGKGGFQVWDSLNHTVSEHTTQEEAIRAAKIASEKTSTTTTMCISLLTSILKEEMVKPPVDLADKIKITDKTHARLNNVAPHHIMEWFYSSVIEACGDGAAVICCGNPKATSEYFIQWWKKRRLPQMKKNGYKKDEFWNPVEEYTGQNGELIVNYYDSNESFMFCDQVIDLGHGDVSFIVESDCKTLDGKFTCLGVDK